jgi:hypothetical protein
MECGASNHSRLLGGRAWQTFAHVPTRRRWINQALTRHRDARIWFAAGVQAVKTFPPRTGQPWGRLCVATESLFAFATR